MTVAAWNLDPPPGFQGLDPNKPLTVYCRHLPHWRQDGATYLVTFRLVDSLPQSKLRELEQLRRDWESRLVGRIGNPSYSKEEWEELTRMTMQRVEEWLDQGWGGCWLKDPEVGRHVVSAMHFFDGDRYELGCYVVMPNHVHAILRPLRPQEHPLERILQSRKRQSSRDINRALRRAGPLWQEESFDRIIRDEEHLYRCIQYIGNNPRRAQLSLQSCLLWIRPQWTALGWTFQHDGL